MSKSILGYYFRSRLRSKEPKTSVNKRDINPTTGSAQSISDNTGELDENLAATDSEREISQEVRKSITSDLAADNLSDSEEADRDSVATDAGVNTLFEPIGGDLSSQDVVPETDYES